MNAEELAAILVQALNHSAKAFNELLQAMQRWSKAIGNVPTYNTLLPTGKVRRRRHIVNALNRTKENRRGR